jgi:para-nitrobenzyl esterase
MLLFPYKGNFDLYSGGDKMSRQVKTEGGIVEGVSGSGCTVFMGIPYAAPPTGELRWKAPQPAAAWQGVFKADRFAAICPQRMPEPGDSFMGRYHKEFYNDPEFLREMSEDCLYLNIWVPERDGAAAETDSAAATDGAAAENPAAGKLPVAFYIHGGGFSGGYSSETEFGGEAFCRKGVILVTIAYRLGIFGFLAHPWLDAENERAISGNYGILDQIAALCWVSRNIAAFGGDPENITVFGQSAGSMSTQVLVSSPLTGSMPAKAILQSGLSCEENILATPTLAEEEEFGKKYVAYTKAATLPDLRKMTADELLGAKDLFDAEMWKSGAGLVMVPNVDGYVLPASVKEVYRGGTMKKIPYMAGCVDSDIGTVPEDLKADRPGIILDECLRWSRRVEEVTGKPAYVYEFKRKLPGDDWGAFHSSELWYMFGTLGRCWRPMTEADRKLSEDMVTYWTDFMKTGSPDPEQNNWKPCGAEV